MAAITVGVHADVLVKNVTIEANNPDGSAALIRLPDDGTGIPVELWIPTNDNRVTITQALPQSWPPVPNDTWIVPGVSKPAFVVQGAPGTLYFCQGTDILTLASSQGRTLPLTTDAALAAFGTALVLLYRPPVADD
jgi:hypothetical protein